MSAAGNTKLCMTAMSLCMKPLQNSRPLSGVTGPAAAAMLYACQMLQSCRWLRPACCPHLCRYSSTLRASSVRLRPSRVMWTSGRGIALC